MLVELLPVLAIIAVAALFISPVRRVDEEKRGGEA